MALQHVRPCPASPNCVSTVADPDDAVHHVEPVGFTVTPAAALDAVERVLRDWSGTRVTERGETHVAAVHTSRVFRFKDDVVFEVDPDAALLHYRSASRVGHHDLGANRRRVAGLLRRLRPHLS